MTSGGGSRKRTDSDNKGSYDEDQQPTGENYLAHKRAKLDRQSAGQNHDYILESFRTSVSPAVSNSISAISAATVMRVGNREHPSSCSSSSSSSSSPFSSSSSSSSFPAPFSSSSTQQLRKQPPPLFQNLVFYINGLTDPNKQTLESLIYAHKGMGYLLFVKEHS